MGVRDVIGGNGYTSARRVVNHTDRVPERRRDFQPVRWKANGIIPTKPPNMDEIYVKAIFSFVYDYASKMKSYN